MRLLRIECGLPAGDLNLEVLGYGMKRPTEPFRLLVKRSISEDPVD